MKISGIYQIQSKIKPNRIYIGSAINIKNRWGVHKNDLINNKHHSKKLQNHYNKYGKNDLVFSVLLGCDKNDLIKTEQYFINSYNPYFNICKIAGNTLGTKRSEEVKMKLSTSHKGQIAWNKGRVDLPKQSPETIAKRLAKRFGYQHSEETKEKIRQKTIGKKRRLGTIVSEETRIKISISLMSNKNSKGKNINNQNAKGKHHILSKETKSKMKLAKQNMSEETKLKMRKPKSVEHRLKIKEALLRRKEHHSQYQIYHRHNEFQN